MGSKINTKESYQFIKTILIAVQGLNKQEQIEYVEKACELRPVMLAKLMKMLNISNSDLVEVLEKPAILSHMPELENQILSEKVTLTIGTKISHYEIKGLIGSGGMGHVYAAQQMYPVKRTVALKLLINKPNQKSLITETQILAHLNHPNIATLYEIDKVGDKTEDKHFFIAMELIKGEDIINWCLSKKCSTKQVIILFQQLCSGISYAHEKNIIHCDIKPNNVLVTDIDGVATVKIIDFGISQFDNQKNSYHEISGTPAYLAPEVLTNKSVSQSGARRDIYALGVLLKKLLPQISPIDLHAIIDKAMAYERQSRYETVKAFNGDLNRFLTKKTVSARDNSVWYVSKLLIQRRIELFIFAALIVMFSLASGFVAQSNQAKAAKIAQQEAEKLSNFLIDIFNVSNPEKRNSSKNESITTSDELLQKASDKLLAIENPSLSDARFMHTIGDIYTRIDYFQKAQLLIEKSLQIKHAQLPETHSDIIIGLSQLGLLYRKLGKLKLSEQSLALAIEKSMAQDQPDDILLAKIHNLLGNLYNEIEQFDKAIEQHKLAVEIRQSGDDLKLLGDSYNNLGVLYNNQQNWESSLNYYYLSLDLFIKEYDEMHPFIGVIKNNMALIEEHLYNWQKSEDLLKDAHVIWKNAYGEFHSNTITALRNLAYFYDRRMRYQEAIEIYQPLILYFEENHNIELQAKYISLIARSFANLQDYQKANHYHQKSIDLIANISIKEKYLFSRIHTKFAVTLMPQGRYLEAIQLSNIALGFIENNYPQNNYHRLYAVNILADIYYQNKDYPHSLEQFNNVLAQNKQSNIRNQKQQVVAYLGLSRINHKQNKLNESQQLLNQALSISQSIYGLQHPSNGVIYYEMALLALSQDKLNQAKDLLRKSLEIQKLALPTKHKDLIATQALLTSLRSS